MRVLQLCTNFRPGGIQRHVLDLTADLRSRGHDVILAGDEGEWSADGVLADYHPVPLARVAATGGALFRRISGLLPCAAAVRRLITSRRVQIIHAHETAPAIAARLATIGRPVPVIMTFHGSEPGREAEVARIARLCARLTISPSRSSLEALIDHGLPRARSRVVGLGVPPPPPADPEDVARLRSALLGGREGVLVLSPSRLAHQKGIDVLIEVARLTRRQRDDVIFAVAGTGPLVSEVEAWARSAGVADCVRFLGQVADVPRHLAAADLCLLTSRWENLPIAIVEAFHAGRPVIATDCGGVRELVDDAVGALCAVGDAPSIAAAIIDLAADRDCRHRKGAAALARSREPRFKPAVAHGEMEAVYREQLVQQGGRAGDPRDVLP